MKAPIRSISWGIVVSMACWAQLPSALAQQPHRNEAPPRPTNLQVLPKNISEQALLAQMHQFTRDLGVHCTFCHEADPQTHRIDFASDVKPEKNTARVMMRMTQAINAQYLATLPGGSEKVTCYTCHRGHFMPETQPPATPPKPDSRP